MALTSEYLASFSSLNLGGNQIGNKGCELLGEAKWPILHQLFICENNMKNYAPNH
jgi:hypothetical protein